MKSLVGGILRAVGLLVAGGSGLCSLWVLPGLHGLAPFVLLFGGVPFLLGLGIWFAGSSLLRDAREERQSGNPPPTDGHDES